MNLLKQNFRLPMLIVLCLAFSSSQAARLQAQSVETIGEYYPVFCNPNKSSHVIVTVNANFTVHVLVNGQFQEFQINHGDIDPDYLLIVGSQHNDQILIQGVQLPSFQINVFGWTGNDTVMNFTSNRSLVRGGDGNDDLLGGSGVDQLRGDAGDDFIDGGPGNDFLFGGSDDDTVLGDLGQDELNGGFGADILDGGLGNDRLHGQGEETTYIGGIRYESPDWVLDEMSGGPGSDEFCHGFHYWDVLSTAIGPLFLKRYHELDQLKDFNSAEDQSYTRYYPKLMIFFPGVLLDP